MVLGECNFCWYQLRNILRKFKNFIFNLWFSKFSDIISALILNVRYFEIGIGKAACLTKTLVDLVICNCYQIGFEFQGVWIYFEQKVFFNKIILFLTIHPIFQTWTLKIKYYQFAIKSNSSGITDNCTFSCPRRGHVTIVGLKTTMIWAK